MGELDWFCTRENKWHLKNNDDVCVSQLEKKITMLHARNLFSDNERYMILNALHLHSNVIGDKK